MMKHYEAEGGCGVIGTACSEKIAGKHLLSALSQMCNRGNGKGGGIAAAGVDPKFFGIDSKLFDENYLLAVAYLDETCRQDLEKDFIHPIFEIDHIHVMEHIPDYKQLKGISLKPPEVILYFVRVKEGVLVEFRDKHAHMTLREMEDGIVYQNSFHLNRAFYSAVGEKRAFVLSHGKNLLVLKMVGFGDDVIRYYQLENLQAHVWIGHHRYPTKGTVWHPGGAHPFVGMNEALVHNGDFANYYSICEYLKQRGIYPLFLTDTEVSVLLFDLLHRRYRYPLEYVIEALAPTTERDFTLLPKEKKEVYHRIQMSHMHSSPDGPWFFLIAQSLHDYRLIGITDTSMLRPQVFALQQGAVSIGLSGSEKQAIDAVLKSLAKDDARFWTEADLYWSARGGSFTDGGAFIFTIHPEKDGTATLKCTDKFGHLIQTPSTSLPSFSISKRSCQIPDLPAKDLYAWGIQHQLNQTYEVAAEFLGAVAQLEPEKALEIFTLLLDGHYPIGKMRRSFLRALIERQINAHLKQQPPKMGQTAIIDAAHLPSEGDDSLARIIVGMYREGMTHFIIFNCSGERFIGNGLGPETKGVRIDVYGSSGDYLASGLDGAEMYVHGSAQDQLGQIMHAGLLVIHGSVGQTFMYGAKGGKAFIRGNTAGRPLINAVGNPRVVINGTALDYLAESFMAGNPLKEGGFVVVNGVTFDAQGEMTEMEIPYPGSNLFSLASGGAIYIRDPRGLISTEQLNGGEFTDMTQEDWDLICPLLEENHAHFNIPLERLLSHQSKTLDFRQIYRKIRPAHTRVLQEEEAWVKRKD